MSVPVLVLGGYLECEGGYTRIRIPQTVMSTCLCLPQFREQTEQWSSDFGTTRPGCVTPTLPLIFNVSYIRHLMSHGTPSLHTFPSVFFVTQRRHPSA